MLFCIVVVHQIASEIGPRDASCAVGKEGELSSRLSSPKRVWKRAVVLLVTMNQIVYTILPKNKLMKISFSNNIFKGEKMLDIAIFFRGALSVGRIVGLVGW